MSVTTEARRTRGTFRELPKDYWEGRWKAMKLPSTIGPASMPDEHAVLKRFLPEGNCSKTLIEVGCAPGRYLDYFYRHLGYAVTGIDYAPGACRITRRNLALLGTPAKIIHGDVFSHDLDRDGYDVVFSTGLVEHFPRTASILRRLAALARGDGGFVVTGVPNLLGNEGWMLRKVRPEVYAGHVPIGLRDLVSMHERAGLKTLFADYTGGCRFPAPLRGTRFARNHPRLARSINLPVLLFNRFMRHIEVARNKCPRSVFWSPGLLYVGQKVRRA